jgi:sporulation protein YlmC with PRC-barrel domain
MKNLTLLAFALALAFAFTTPVVHAQGLSHGQDIVMVDHSMRASKLVGLKVYDDQGKPLGTIVDILVKAEASEPTVILKSATGGKLVAAPLSHIKLEGKKIMMPGTTPAMMASMPAFKFEAATNGT